MLKFLLQSTRGYRWRPWVSPYLRWRMETYAGIAAETVDRKAWFQFMWRNRASLWIYLKWVSGLQRLTR